MLHNWELWTGGGAQIFDFGAPVIKNTENEAVWSKTEDDRIIITLEGGEGVVNTGILMKQFFSFAS